MSSKVTSRGNRNSGGVVDHHRNDDDDRVATTNTTKKTHTTSSGNSNSSFYKKVVSILNDMCDVAINYLVVTKVEYTEIDWSTYMQQITLFMNGERDYTKLEGDTGPVVYPAGFIYVFAVLRQLTDLGANIGRAQIIFAALAVATSALVFAIYGRDRKHVPGYVLAFLILSKRIHSIFGLRLFNDGLTMFRGSQHQDECTVVRASTSTTAPPNLRNRLDNSASWHLWIAATGDWRAIPRQSPSQLLDTRL
ncbi:glycosyltransferase [Heterostelium album PN500]|uniref:dolichyl-P-Man:Man5GlcNAc2-PP-dolichol alpha-1,3-mannosyltransferase n=1 Tax=Heterostelium pallidum (strain ATCC 26659 / Pp 5 / PN500) TaxID=670386 RepID=D3BRN2_HETP5|nr:glycosyltransferase [Heterostelium album PN500]EFA76064.1 glycosyltransferase [Heterostelium album PN500]|eukprot:XP_020428198.1 glycosyltransferase [Heterostelium album PN500]